MHVCGYVSVPPPDMHGSRRTSFIDKFSLFTLWVPEMNSVLSFHCVSPENWTWVVRFGNRHIIHWNNSPDSLFAIRSFIEPRAPILAKLSMQQTWASAHLSPSTGIIGENFWACSFFFLRCPQVLNFFAWQALCWLSTSILLYSPLHTTHPNHFIE